MDQYHTETPSSIVGKYYTKREKYLAFSITVLLALCRAAYNPLVSENSADVSSDAELMKNSLGRLHHFAFLSPIKTYAASSKFEHSPVMHMRPLPKRDYHTQCMPSVIASANTNAEAREYLSCIQRELHSARLVVIR